MAKATHNGHCQACGRLQAVTPRGIANHGYTVDYGFFHGTCRGSGFRPLEENRAQLDSTVTGLRGFAARLRLEAEGQITKVPVEIRKKDPTGRTARIRETIQVTESEFHMYRPKYERFEHAVESLRFSLRNRAKKADEYADHLLDLAAQCHGKPLPERGA